MSDSSATVLIKDTAYVFARIVRGRPPDKFTLRQVRLRIDKFLHSTAPSRLLTIKSQLLGTISMRLSVICDEARIVHFFSIFARDDINKIASRMVLAAAKYIHLPQMKFAAKLLFDRSPETFLFHVFATNSADELLALPPADGRGGGINPSTDQWVAIIHRAADTKMRQAILAKYLDLGGSLAVLIAADPMLHKFSKLLSPLDMLKAAIVHDDIGAVVDYVEVRTIDFIGCAVRAIQYKKFAIAEKLIEIVDCR